MKKDELEKLKKQIEEISNHFENKPWTANVKFMKDNFDINSLKTPNHYLKIIDQLEEILREARILFIYSVLNIVCKEENKIYYFDKPFRASMKYKGVMKNNGTFYLLDEDGDYREIFTSKEFVEFIDNQYWNFYEK